MDQGFAIKRNAVLEIEGKFVVFWSIHRTLLLGGATVFLCSTQMLPLRGGQGRARHHAPRGARIVILIPRHQRRKRQVMVEEQLADRVDATGGDVVSTHQPIDERDGVGVGGPVLHLLDG